MTTCEAISSVLVRYGRTPRHHLPDFLLSPSDDNEWNLAFAVAASANGIEPICADGVLVGWAGAGWRCRDVSVG